MIFPAADPVDRNHFPVDEWALVETDFDAAQAGRNETLFTVGNGYLGLRGNLDEGRDGYDAGTFINGFHETWPIQHAEEAFGFARVGQTIVNVPDAKIIRLYVDDEPFMVTRADILRHTRRLDFADGTLTREIEWRTPSGKHVLIRSRRMVSFTDRHLALIDYEVEMLDADASVLISSQILNRQDGMDEYHVSPAGDGSAFDPRKAESFRDRVLQPRLKRADGPRYLLGYSTTNSRMTIACGIEHEFRTDNEWDQSSHIEDDLAKHVYRVKAKPGRPVRLLKTVSYHTSRSVPARELADRCCRTLDRAREMTLEEHLGQQKDWLADFWGRSDVAVEGQPAVQQAIRWNLFQLAQSTARTDGGGIAAKGVSGSGYGGHYFWDTEVYVLPFLSYTAPVVARNALRFRQAMLDAARSRAAELNQRGALFPWRTINGQESSAYYAASTAQYHIDADISYALMQYVAATGDDDFLYRGAVDILVETARMWADLGFWRSNGDDNFHIHGVTGPDEYTTVVNDNLYTNVMARANLRSAVHAVDSLRAVDPAAHARMAARLRLEDDELVEWTLAAEKMFIPFDERAGIHPQDAAFLDKELWDLENTPPTKRPLLLHFHPLVIYRFQVLKQADVVLALLLQGHEFTMEQKRSDFEYYEALTTGDSTLSAVVQSIIAAEVGYHDLALRYFLSSLFVDLADLHRNTSDGIHVASTGGVWSALVYGFGGMRDHGGQITFHPRLPETWTAVTFRVMLHGTRLRVEVRQDAMTLTVETGGPTTVSVQGRPVAVAPGTPVTVPLDGQGPRLTGTPTTSDIEGSRRADGSLVTASIPRITVNP
ncbi:glycoside hydrolase family 65 protein [Arthrobacter agilis]|uniref:glycoside hydrolase family 65 protein n=1 Tax=Arthrobacter agilis TaxID=37921 RepID=UPI000B34EA7A|nr:glycosyl hydrolase family 65 protein [Arthrobacter agilis]OUM42132.1 family 65 glycosyl hydrolase [Arthrobacter agilis]PPB45477.1 glycoside hydrolase family 65 protein [Arthrobacter agilis]TPV26547.1 glycoside hydrolase family 65 protein [Arthrobacter agilis]VDR33540.1 Kojibiose phosphorylase [Arthrobacter agilis]